MASTEVEVRRVGEAAAVRVATTSLVRSVTDADVDALRAVYERLLEDASSPLVLYIRDASEPHATQPLSMQACVSILTAISDVALHKYAHLRAIVVHVVVLDDLARAVANLFLSLYTLAVPLRITDDGEEARAFLDALFPE